MESILRVRGITKSFALGAQRQAVLRGIDLDIMPGEFVALVGPSGSGKTTLLNLIGCLDTPDAGSILIDGTEVTHLSLRHQALIRLKKIGYIFQNFNLLPVLSARENVEYPLTLFSDIPAKVRRDRAEAALAAVELQEHMQKRPTEMSGGQQQRVAVARALVTQPRLILADEPTAHLDQQTGQSIMVLMQQLCREQGLTFLYTTHDPTMMEAASRVVRLRDGVVYHDPLVARADRPAR